MAVSVMFSSMLFEPFAGAEIEDCGGEEDDGCDGEDCVVHKRENRVCVLRNWSAVDKDFVRRARTRMLRASAFGSSGCDTGENLTVLRIQFAFGLPGVPSSSLSSTE